MSIYFVHVITALLGLCVFGAFISRSHYFSRVFIPSLVGIIFGILIFKFAKYSLLEPQFRLFFDGLSLVVLAFAFFVIFFEFKLKSIIFGLLGFCYGGGYASISSLFPLFDGELLDTLSIISFFLVCIAFIVLSVLFFLLCALVGKIKDIFGYKIMLVFAFLIWVVMIMDKGSTFTLELMRAGLIGTHTTTLSIVAKIIYFVTFTPYFYLVLVAILLFICLFARPSLIDKASVGSIAYRFCIASRDFITRRVIYCFSCVVLTVCFMLYFDLYASRPLQIDEPTYVEPVNGVFKFDTQKLDNKLHRYAYITDEGRVVRFFIINRYEDKPSPVIVFDACSICGDSGYVKKGSELICISCNVRIFLPSVGQEGGCNPIPMKFSFDGKSIIVDLQEIQKGAGYFSKVVEKMVTDPVSGVKLSNQSSRSYRYKGRTYYFENKDNLNKFEADPEKFVGADK